MKTLIDRLSHWMMVFCARNLPQHRIDWAKAMRAEFEQIDGVLERLSWATGCFVTTCRARSATMSESRLSRPMLVLAWLFCFAFLTFAFVAWVPLAWTTLTSAEMLQASVEQRQPIFFVIVAMELLRCLIGPLGLVLIYLRLANRSHPTSTRTTVMLTATLLFLGVSLPILYAVQAGDGNVLSQWREFVLLTLLPAIGLLHMHLHATGSDAQESLAG